MFDVNNIATMKSRLGVTRFCELMHDLYIAEIYRQWAPKNSYLWWGGALKFIEIDTNQKPVYDFLLFFHCNCMPIFYRFWDIMIYWSQMYVFAIFTHPFNLKPSQGVPLGPRVWKLVSKNQIPWAMQEWQLHDPKVISFDVRQMDGRTRLL